MDLLGKFFTKEEDAPVYKVTNDLGNGFYAYTGYDPLNCLDDSVFWILNLSECSDCTFYFTLKDMEYALGSDPRLHEDRFFKS